MCTNYRSLGLFIDKYRREAPGTSKVLAWSISMLSVIDSLKEKVFEDDRRGETYPKPSCTVYPI
jgi:hypothetical protein